VLALVLVGCNSKDAAAVKAAPRIADSAFEAASSQVCKQGVHVFDTASTLSKEPTNAQSADLLSAIDQTFAAMVLQLKAIPVAAADQAAVGAWLADWDTYVAFGKTYAAAVRIGAERDLIRANTASQGDLRRRRNAFAKANHMPSCVFA
jgi:hypothetical protein